MRVILVQKTENRLNLTQAACLYQLILQLIIGLKYDINIHRLFTDGDELAVFAEVVSKSYWGKDAIDNHDTVAYHDLMVREEHQEVKGNKAFVVKYKIANWYFASQQSADKFASAPQKYEPRYNGFCANALSLGEGLIPISGKVREFFGDQLHLFYAERGRQRWMKGEWQSSQKQANSAWQALRNG